MFKEIWKPIPGALGYDASSLGRIRSPNKILKTDRKINNSGYEGVSLNRNTPRLVHRCIALAFHGVPDEGMEVNHKNGNRRDNRAENLEWVTPKQNMAHAANGPRRIAWRKGLSEKRKGANNPNSSLEWHEIKSVILLGSLGIKQSEIGKRFGVSQTAISNILRANGIRKFTRKDAT